MDSSNNMLFRIMDQDWNTVRNGNSNHKIWLIGYDCISFQGRQMCNILVWLVNNKDVRAMYLTNGQEFIEGNSKGSRQ